MSRYFPSVLEAAREQFETNLGIFLKRAPGWTRSTLLRAAGMDMSLISRIEGGKGFSVTALDRLQETMDDVIDGRLTTPPLAKKPARRMEETLDGCPR